MHKKVLYNKATSGESGLKYKSREELAPRNFLKGYLSDPPLYGLRGNEFKNYTELIEFLKGYSSRLKVSKSSISKLRNRRMVYRGVPRTPETLAFVAYVESKLDGFRREEFMSDKVTY